MGENPMITADISGFTHIEDARAEITEIQKTSPQWENVLHVFTYYPPKIEALRSILTLGNLSENWDSYGSQPPNRNTIELACQLLIGTAEENFIPPKAIPVSGGAVQLIWENKPNALEIIVTPDGFVEILSSKEGEIVLEKEYKAEDLAQAQSLLSSWMG